MRSTDTQILGSPVNKNAAMSYAKGEEKRFHIKDPRHAQWDAPPKMRRYTGDKSSEMTGLRKGRLSVVGYYALKTGRWVVRCDCGMYEIRTIKALKNPNNNGDACNECRTLVQRRREAVRKQFYDEHGKWPDECDGAEAKRITEQWDNLSGVETFSGVSC